VLNFALNDCVSAYIFITAFLLGTVMGATALGELEIPHGFQKSQAVPQAPHQDRIM